jgi:hypothetical protein
MRTVVHAVSVAQKIRGGQAEQFIPELMWRKECGAGVANDEKNLTPNLFASGKENQRGHVRNLMASN